MTIRSLRHRGELLVSIGLIALGVYTLIRSQTFATMQGYDQIGPRLFPDFIGGGLIILGGVLGWHALSGGWRHVPLDQEGRDNPDWFAFTVIGLALIAHMALIGSIGFVLASTLLFTLVARGFGSRRWLRDGLIGAVLAFAAFYLFTLGLGLNLPKGPFGGI